MKDSYFESVNLIEKLHRLFLDVVKLELERIQVKDINNVQAVVLYNIGKNSLTVGELTNRGYYLGSNVSYNLRKMVKNEYVKQKKSQHDGRSSTVELKPKGLELYEKIDAFLHRQSTELKEKLGSDKELTNFVGMLKSLENFWSDMAKH